MLWTVQGITGDLVMSKDDPGYQEVMAAMARADSVTVVTYNISRNHDGLIDQLRGLNCEVRLITNIPNWWPYYNPEGRANAKKAIGKYMAKLNPDEFGPEASIYFCFNNHAKVVMTDGICYVGSANYSEESAKNWEFGVVVRAPAAIKAVSDLVDEIEKDSVRYYGARMRKSVTPLLGARQRLLDIIERLGADFEMVEVKELKETVEGLREAIADSDIAWSEAFNENGPLYGRIDTYLLHKIEDWFDEQLSVWELEVATKKLRDAEAGNIDAGELPVNNDGVIIDSAFEDIIENLTVERETWVAKVQGDIAGLQAMIVTACEQVADVCRDISTCIKKIDNT